MSLPEEVEERAQSDGEEERVEGVSVGNGMSGPPYPFAPEAWFPQGVLLP